MFAWYHIVVSLGRGIRPVFNSGIFRRPFLLFAILVMFFAQIEGTFDDIPQFVNTISKALIASSQSARTGDMSSSCKASFDNTALVEADDEDDSIPALHCSTFIHALLRLQKKPESSLLRAVCLIESGTRKDKSPPTPLV